MVACGFAGSNLIGGVSALTNIRRPVASVTEAIWAPTGFGVDRVAAEATENRTSVLNSMECLGRFRLGEGIAFTLRPMSSFAMRCVGRTQPKYFKKLMTASKCCEMLHLRGHAPGATARDYSRGSSKDGTLAK